MSEKIMKVEGNRVITNKDRYARIDKLSWYFDRGHKSKRVKICKALDLENIYKIHLDCMCRNIK